MGRGADDATGAAVARVSDAPRLMCDEMLRGIGRWLRVAGYDTAIASDAMTDRDLLALAGAESRVVLTCDRKLARLAPAGVRVVTLATESLDGAARELPDRLGLDWLRAPFSRCLVDNGQLEPACEADLARIPEQARQGEGSITVCPVCRRVYWPGSHVRRMRARLERWQRAADPSGLR